MSVRVEINDQRRQVRVMVWDHHMTVADAEVLLLKLGAVVESAREMERHFRDAFSVKVDLSPPLVTAAGRTP